MINLDNSFMSSKPGKIEDSYDVVIVGGGPAGLAAGLYAARTNLKVVLLERGIPGGELLNTELIEDYPGFRSITGFELAQKMEAHARDFGLEIRMEEVQLIKNMGEYREVKTNRATYHVPAVIVASGGTPKKLGVPGEAEFAGRGVSYCAVCDGAFFTGEEIAVVGGGDSAMEEADFLTRYASKVYLIHRRSEFRAQAIIRDRALANPKITTILNAQVKSINGDDKVTSITYVQDGVEKELSVAGVFIFIGFQPNNNFFADHVEHDEVGYIITDQTMATNIPGIWAVGDVRHQLTKQITTAVGDGTTAAIAVAKYLAELKHAKAVSKANAQSNTE